MTTGYCMKCKKKQTIVNGNNVVTKNKMNAIKGNCGQCSGGMYKILSKSTKSKKPTKSKKVKKSKKTKKSKKSRKH